MGKNFKVYEIFCGKCNEYVLTYHKYGAGKGILRLYLHRIAAPEKWSDLNKAGFRKVNDVPNLDCPSCGEVLGVPTVSKGQKWAFRMRQGLFHRKLRKR
jgi:hypothetical protein